MPSVLNKMLHVIGNGLPRAVRVLKVIEATTLVLGNNARVRYKIVAVND